ncbi:recombinase family protein [Streptomyces boninensis]|uniref:recombinase family protein n=1 Tax=Streptomyces boninensis TaxID=2039455 RepID=UPI003B22292B
MAASIAGGCAFEQWLAGRVPVASYARISRADPAAVRRQHLNNQVAAVRLGWAVVCQYTDDGVSAADRDAERPAFRRMLVDVEARSITEAHLPVRGVLAVEEERLVRSGSDYVALLRALAAQRDGCLSFADTGEIVDVQMELARMEAQGDMVPGEAESIRIGRRRQRSIRDQALEGRGSGGQRRFGWLGPDIVSGRLTNTLLDPCESAYLRTAIERALVGEKWMEVTDWLTAERVPTVRGGMWTIPTVQAMVTNPAICGYRILDGALVRDRETGLAVVGDWQTVASPAEWRALIGRCDRWYSLDGKRVSYTDGYRARSRGNGPGPGRQQRNEVREAKRKYLLSGFLRCGHVPEGGSMCGAKLGGHPAHGTNRYPAYRCSASGCRKVGRRTDLVDTYVAEIVRAQLGIGMDEWQSAGMQGKRSAIARVVRHVVIHPIPAGRSKSAPFDVELLEVVLTGGQDAPDHEA